ncbi:hypothetical protein [Candidatus Vidania fulgoroideorum]
MKKIIPINNFVIIKLLIKKSKIINNLMKSNIGKVVFINCNKKIKIGDKIIFSTPSLKKLNYLSSKYIYLKYKKIIGIIKNV